MDKELIECLSVFDQTVKEFLELHPKIPLNLNKLVFDSPACLNKYAVSSEIRNLYNQLYKLLTTTIYKGGEKEVYEKIVTNINNQYQDYFITPFTFDGVFRTTFFFSKYAIIKHIVRMY